MPFTSMSQRHFSQRYYRNRARLFWALLLILTVVAAYSCSSINEDRLRRDVITGYEFPTRKNKIEGLQPHEVSRIRSGNDLLVIFGGAEGEKPSIVKCKFINSGTDRPDSTETSKRLSAIDKRRDRLPTYSMHKSETMSVQDRETSASTYINVYPEFGREMVRYNTWELDAVIDMEEQSSYSSGGSSAGTAILIVLLLGAVGLLIGHALAPKPVQPQFDPLGIHRASSGCSTLSYQLAGAAIGLGVGLLVAIGIIAS